MIKERSQQGAMPHQWETPPKSPPASVEERLASLERRVWELESWGKPEAGSDFLEPPEVPAG
jgi:hypothetical protein